MKISESLAAPEDDTVVSRDGEISKHQVVRWTEDSKTIKDEDEEPVFGLSAVRFAASLASIIDISWLVACLIELLQD